MRIDLANAIDWTNPINRGRVGLWAANVPGCLAGGRLLELCFGNHCTASGGYGVNRGNPFLVTPFATGTFGTSEPRPVLGLGSTCSLTTRVRIRAAEVGGNRSFVHRWYATAPTGGYTLQLLSGRAVAVFRDGASKQIFPTAGAIAAERWYTITATYDGAGNGVIYVDGVLAGSASTAGMVGLYVGANTLRLMGRSDSTEVTNGDMAYASVWNRVLTPAEVRADYCSGLVGFVGRESPLRWLSRTAYFRMAR